jgi:pimeloyl-ACP methyl ester carboxylesterase
MEGINVLLNKRVWERYKEEVLPSLKIADYSFLENCKEPINFNVDEFEKPYMKPTLMLVGRQDSVVGYRGLWNIIEMYPRASFVLLDKAGHALQIEQDVLFSETVKEWLSRVAAEMEKANGIF